MRSSLRVTLLAAAVTAGGAGTGLALASASAASVAHAAGKSFTVNIKNFKFTPSSLTIPPGSTVKWVWLDAPTEHNVTSSKFKSSRSMTRGTYSVVFTKKGTYAYDCTIHPFMTGKIVVT